MHDMGRTPPSRGLWTALILGVLAGASIAAYRARRRQHATQTVESPLGARADDLGSPLERSDDAVERMGGATPYRGDGAGSTLPGSAGTSSSGPGSTAL